MNTASPNYLSELLRGNDEVLERARDLEKLLTDAQLSSPAPQGGWTAGQILEHLVVSGRLYIDRIDAIIDKGFADGQTRKREWKPSLMGGMIMRAVHPRSLKRFRTQKVFEPGPAPRPKVIRALIEMHEQLAKQIRRAEGLDLRSVKITSPVSSLIRLNLGDAFGILVFHSQRHLLQVGRTLGSDEGRVTRDE